MLHFSRYKTIAILASVVLALIFALPNVLSPAGQDFMLKTIGARPMTLGLDLQGGSNVVMEVDKNDLRNQLLQHEIFYGTIQYLFPENNLLPVCSHATPHQNWDDLQKVIPQPSHAEDLMISNCCR